ncbi:cytochrome P450 87A3-like [Vigna unguiculata]|uniref:cytochrome P450 87A3-like n=1 Tax=Vigna unguiculata TaxID=3917 RepID=UPI0010160386|nr:cytochrome P450 87A3-like [Vigna unguiculata]
MWVLCLATLIFVSITHWVYRWRNPSCNGKLPPGSLGFPLLGESLQFFTPYTSSDINPFIKQRMNRYGPIFKTGFAGRPTVVSTDPKFNHLIFQQEGEMFKSWYPDTLNEILGKQNFSSLHGVVFKYVKNMVFKMFGPEGLKRMLSEVDQKACTTLQQWSCQDAVELMDATKRMIFGLTAKKLLSCDSKETLESLMANFVAFMEGLISLPLYIPGTPYYKCLQGRKRAMKKLKKMLQERREKPRKEESDFFDYVVDELSKEGTLLNEEMALDLMFTLLFASFETTSLALTYAIKALSDHPSVLKRLEEEHEGILKGREDPNSGLTWQEYKSMTFTLQVINETIRLANIVPGIFRKTLQDVKYGGYTIPEGWAIMICPPAVHLNPTLYEDPLSFNPWRWEGMEMSGASKHFMAFGGGMRFCVGADFAKVQMAVFLHNLVTKYKWRPIKGGNIVRNLGLRFPDGFYVRITEKDPWKYESE